MSPHGHTLLLTKVNFYVVATIFHNSYCYCSGTEHCDNDKTFTNWLQIDSILKYNMDFGHPSWKNNPDFQWKFLIWTYFEIIQDCFQLKICHSSSKFYSISLNSNTIVPVCDNFVFSFHFSNYQTANITEQVFIYKWQDP